MKNQAAFLKQLGKRSRFMILFSFCGLFCAASMTADGLNVALPLITGAHGLDYSLCLSFGTLAGFVSIVTIFFIGKLRERIGSCKIAGGMLICAGLVYATIYVGANSTVMYAIALCILVSCGRSCTFLGITAMHNQWFPRKKGITMGISSLGSNTATAVIVPVLSGLAAWLGYRLGLSMLGIFAVVMGVLALLILKDNPIDVGEYPDGVSKENYETEYLAEQKNNVSTYKSDWTVKKLLRTKETYLAAIIPGTSALAVSGVVSQFVIRYQELGMTAAKAAAAMTVAAVLGGIGNYVFGAIENRFGAQKGVMIYFGFFIVALLVNVLSFLSPVLLYLSVIMLGCSFGGTIVYQMAWPTSIFGRLDYATANGVVYPLMNCVSCMNFFISALIRQKTGHLTGAYLIFAGMLLVMMVIAGLTDATKWNKDVHPELMAGGPKEAAGPAD